MTRSRSFSYLTIFFFILAIVVTVSSLRHMDAGPSNSLYVVPLKGTISGGTADFINRALREAEARKGEAVLIELRTFGGELNAMAEIADAMTGAKIPIYVFIQGRAISAGAYIALSGERIVMSPDAVMGASQPRTANGQPVPEKEMAAFKKMFKAAAEARAQRVGVELDPRVAEAMVDPEVEVAGVTAKGNLLALTAEEAMSLGYADLIAKNRNEAVLALGLSHLTPVEIQQTPVEGLVRFLTDPYISSLLLIVGFTALIIEVFTAGFGVAGVVGILSLLSFFGARFLSGLAGFEVFVLFILGLILLAAEIFVVPGFGIPGILGLLSIGGSIVLSYATSSQGLVALGLSLVWTFFLVSLALQFLKKRGFFQRIVLSTSLSGQAGYSAVPLYQEYLGKTGKVVHPLRPAGVVELEDGKRLDVVSEGAYIPGGEEVKVVAVEGRRIVVRRIAKE